MRLFACISVVILSCYVVGIALKRKFPLMKTFVKYTFPLGLFTLLGVFQIISFPLAAFHVSMDLVILIFSGVYIGIIIGSILIILAHRETKVPLMKKDKSARINYGVEYGFVLLFILFHLGICFTSDSLNITTADQTFYINLVESNVGTSAINMIHPLTGEVQALQSIYNFQSYYLVLSYLAQLFAIPSVQVTVWLAPVLLWLVVVFSLLNMVNLFNIYKDNPIKKVSLLAVLYLLIVSFDYLVKYNMYGNNFRPYIFLYILLFYYRYFSTKDYRSLYIVAVLFSAAIAVQSTSLFISIMLLTALYLYDLFIVKAKSLNALLLSSIPVIMYVFCYYGYMGKYNLIFLLIVAIDIYVILMNIRLIKNTLIMFFYSRTMKILVITFIIALNGLGLILQLRGLDSYPANLVKFKDYYLSYYSFKWDASVTTTILNMIVWIFKSSLLITNLYLVSKLRELSGLNKYLIWLQLFIIAVFYNPFVCALISKYGTGSVYFRTRDLVFSMLLIAALVVFIANKLETVDLYVNFIYNKVKTLELSVRQIVFPIILIAILLNGSIMVYKYYLNSYNRINKERPYNYAYRLYDDIVETAQMLDEYIKEHYIEKPTVLANLFEISYLSHQFKMAYDVDFVRNRDNWEFVKANQNIYYINEVLTYSDYYGEEDYQAIIELIPQQEINFLIVDSAIQPMLMNQLYTIGNSLYQNEKFTVFELNH